MTTREAILAKLGELGNGLCDDCLSRLTLISPRQAINQNCRQLRTALLITRTLHRCPECGGEKLVNKIGANRGASLKTAASILPQVSVTRPWSWEGQVQGVLANFLGSSGWVVTRVADTARKERGKDIEAS